VCRIRNCYNTHLQNYYYYYYYYYYNYYFIFKYIQISSPY